VAKYHEVAHDPLKYKSACTFKEWRQIMKMFEEPALPILLYHECPSNLEKQFKTIRDCGYSPVHLAEVKGYFEQPNKLPASCLVLTFDDALQDFFDTAVPLLRRFNFPATICVPTGYVSDDPLRRRISNWKNNEDSTSPIMTWNELNKLKQLTTIGGKALIEFASHSVRHTNLNEIEFDENALRYEIECSKSALKYLLEVEDPIFFCFPYGGGEGKPLPEKLLKETGYAGALMVEGVKWDPYRLPRYEVQDKDGESKLRLWLNEQRDIAQRFNAG
jgi:peptidoglycan/xylan/chitin deacetylase (PgdA/CDA1 family)